MYDVHVRDSDGQISAGIIDICKSSRLGCASVFFFLLYFWCGSKASQPNRAFLKVAFLCGMNFHCRSCIAHNHGPYTSTNLILRGYENAVPCKEVHGAGLSNFRTLNLLVCKC